MGISFQSIPQSLRTPLFYAELDSAPNYSPAAQRSLQIAPMLAGTAQPNVPVLQSGAAVGRTLFGAKSVANDMVRVYRLGDSYREMWVLPVADPVAGVAAAGELTVNTPATASGTLFVAVADRTYQILVTNSMAVADIAAAIAAAVNADSTAIVTATSAAAVVTLTATHKGLIGNDIEIGLSPLGAAGGQPIPADFTATLTAFSGGTGTPDLTAALAALGDMPFDFIGTAFTYAASVATLAAFQAQRWAWDQMNYGGVFGAVRASVANLEVFGDTLNSAHLSLLGYSDSLSTPWQWAAAYTAAAAVSVSADCGLPLQTLALAGIVAPPVQSRFNLSDRNTLLQNGISTFTVDAGGTVRLETTITTYKTDAYGDPDDEFLYVERLYLAAYQLRFLRGKSQTTYGRVKLADDGTVFRAGAAIVTPSVIRASLVAWYRDMVSDGYAQDADAFAASLVVQRNAQNRCRIDAQLPLIPIDQLRQLCAAVTLQPSVGQ